ncbi:hypothetical protein B0H11DRAFT_2225811 [Mycena galericulata]|nr:hypothetical protein B0H11DRAFT_2225811 [Mycena galericulata]
MSSQSSHPSTHFVSSISIAQTAKQAKKDTSSHSAAVQAHRLAVAQHRSRNIEDLREKARLRMARYFDSKLPHLQLSAPLQPLQTSPRYRAKHSKNLAAMQKIYRIKKDKTGGGTKKGKSAAEVKQLEEWAAENRWAQAMPDHMKTGNVKVMIVSSN